MEIRARRGRMAGTVKGWGGVMRSLDQIMALAVARKGSAAAVLAGAVSPLPADALAAIPDDRWLAAMARGILQAGISWTVVDAKWPGIEDAFMGFDPGRVALIDPDGIEALLADPRVIRSGAKLVAIRENAQFIREVTAESGGFGRRIGDWPISDFAGLLGWMAQHAARLGGTTGQYMLRQMGKEGFLLSRDVLARLTAEGVITGSAASPRALRAVQAAFDQWQRESGLTFNQINRILARSIDAG